MTKTTLTQKEITAFLRGKYSDPATLLGMHDVAYHDHKKFITVRAILPDAEQAFVYDTKKQQSYPMTRIHDARIHDAGLFEALFSRRRKFFPYQLETIDSQGKKRRFADPYSFPLILLPDELALFTQGNHYDIYKQLGCHPMEIQGISGTLFAVWAPNAKRVSVIGDFNNWNGQTHPMRFRKTWGVWELFIPEVMEGEHYQYEIVTQTDEVLTKADPYGTHFEQPPRNTTIVTGPNHFAWRDQEWIEERQFSSPLKSAISVYEVHSGSWLKKTEKWDDVLSYRELAGELIPYVKEMGFTHIEMLPVAEHPFYASWGYQVTGYYAPTSRHGSPDDFKHFVDECHRQGIGVIVDWVPAHFPKDEFSLGLFDGTYLYEHADPRQGEHKDWGTLIFDYGRNEVRNFLIANVMFWFEQYHIDGIRVDAVASMLYLDYSRQEGEWTPNKYGGRENLEAISFLKELNAVVHERFPGVMTIAEESTTWLGVTYPVYLGGLEFTFKWNLGWMNDMLHYLSHDPVHRKFVHTMVPFALLYAFHEHFMLELSHDEVVYGKGSLLAKMPGDEWQKFANLRLLYGFMFGHPGKKLLFMGNEFGQRTEWNHDRSLAWDLLEDPLHQGLQHFVRDLNHLYISEPALYFDDTEDWCFQWIDHHDFENSIFAFVRRASGEHEQIVICVYNFTPVTRSGYRLGVPWPGFYHELVNSDADIYGGRNVSDVETYYAESIPWQHQPYSIELTLPPLGLLILKPGQKMHVSDQSTAQSIKPDKQPNKAATGANDKQDSEQTQESKISKQEYHEIAPEQKIDIFLEKEETETEGEQSSDVLIEASVIQVKRQAQTLKKPKDTVVRPPTSLIAKPQGSKAAISGFSETPARKSSG